MIVQKTHFWVNINLIYYIFVKKQKKKNAENKIKFKLWNLNNSIRRSMKIGTVFVVPTRLKEIKTIQRIAKWKENLSEKKILRFIKYTNRIVSNTVSSEIKFTFYSVAPVRI